ERIAQRFHRDACHHALMAAAAIEAIEALGRYAQQAHAGALRRRGEILAAGVVARLVEEDLHHRRRIGAQAREHGVETEHYARLALAAHRLVAAGTRSILRWSTSTRTSCTLMRSARRKRFLVRSP